MGKQMVRCPRDERVARPSAMIHLLPVAPWIMAVFACHVSMLPTTPPKIRDGQQNSIAGGGRPREDVYLRDDRQAALGIKRRGGRPGVEVKGLVELDPDVLEGMV